MTIMKTNIKTSDIYALAIAAVAEKYTTNGVRLDTDELSDVLAYLCDQRDTALYVEQCRRERRQGQNGAVR